MILSDPNAKPFPFSNRTLPRRFTPWEWFPPARGQGDGWCEEFSAWTGIDISRTAAGLPLLNLSYTFLPAEAKKLFGLPVENLYAMHAGMLYRDFGVCLSSLHGGYNMTPSAAAEADAATRRGAVNYNLKPMFGALDPLMWREPNQCGIPVLAPISIWSSFAMLGRSEVAPMPDTATEPYLGGHQIVICGWDDDIVVPGFPPGASLGQNNWGIDWGFGGNEYFWLPYEYTRRYGSSAMGAWGIATTTSTTPLSFPPPTQPPTGAAVTFDETLASIKTGAWTPTQRAAFRAAAADPVVVQPPVQPAGNTPNGTKVPGAAAIIVASGKWTLGPSPGPGLDPPVLRNGGNVGDANLLEQVNGECECVNKYGRRYRWANGGWAGVAP